MFVFYICISASPPLFLPDARLVLFTGMIWLDWLPPPARESLSNASGHCINQLCPRWSKSTTNVSNRSLVYQKGIKIIKIGRERAHVISTIFRPEARNKHLIHYHPNHNYPNHNYPSRATSPHIILHDRTTTGIQHIVISCRRRTAACPPCTSSRCTTPSLAQTA